MAKVRDLFRDAETTEFVIVTIPTVSFLTCWDTFHVWNLGHKQ